MDQSDRSQKIAIITIKNTQNTELEKQMNQTFTYSPTLTPTETWSHAPTAAPSYSEFYDESDESDALDLVIKISIGVFFFGWNFCAAFPVFNAVSDLWRGRYTNDVIILLSPHWYCGAFIPIIFGCAKGGGILGAILMLFISFIVPYAIVFCIQKCSRPGAPQRAHAAANDGGARVSPADTATGDRDIETGMIDPSTLEGKERKRYVEKALLFGTVTEESTSTTLASGNDTEASFRAQHPKMKMKIPRKETDKLRGDNRRAKQSADEQEQECSICLETYERGDVVCWSRNPACHHAFHKDCAFRLLETHTDCPVCRRPYIGPKAFGPRASDDTQH